MRSKSEVKFSDDLRAHKVHFAYESDRVPYVITKSKTYIPDFTVRKSNGAFVFLEVKGWFRSQDRTKLLSVIRSNPGIDLRLVFERNNRLNKDSETTYADWAEKHDIKYTIGLKLPEEWLRELKSPKIKKTK